MNIVFLVRKEVYEYCFFLKECMNGYYYILSRKGDIRKNPKFFSL